MKPPIFTNSCSSPTLLINLILFLIISLYIPTLKPVLARKPTSTSSTTQTYKTYLKNACNSTTYPTLCFRSLSSYASNIKTNPKKLCNTALIVALNAAKDTSLTVSNLSKKNGLTRYEAGVVKDCVYNIKDSIYELKRSLHEMRHLGADKSSDVGFQIDSVKTWVSAALTDESTCTDEFDEKKVRDDVKREISKCVLIVAKLSSNALALVNGFNYYS